MTLVLVIDHPMGGNYEAKLEAALSQVKPGDIYEAAVAHDDWCALLSGRGPCNCDPDVTMKKVTP